MKTKLKNKIEKIKTDVLTLNQSDKKAIAILKDFTSGADRSLKALSSGFQKAYHALAGVHASKWSIVLDEAGVSVESSYRSTLKRAALDPKASDKLLESAGSINKAIKLLPTQAPQTATGSTTKGGRPAKTDDEKLEDQTRKAVGFLLDNYEVSDIISMVKEAASNKPKADDEEED